MKSEWILSKDVREYIEQIQYVFTDQEEASILYQHPTMSRKDKRMQLKKLADRTEDQRLKTEILSYLKEEQKELEAFQKLEPGMVFGYGCDEDGFDSEIYNICTNYEAARQQGMMEDFGLTFHVTKIPISSEAKLDDPGKWRSVYFEPDGEILSTDTVWREKRKFLYGEIPVMIPHPFHQGEAVYNVLTEQYGIVMDQVQKPTDKLHVAVLEEGKWLPVQEMSSCVLEFEELPMTDVRQEIFEAVNAIMNQDMNALYQLQEAMRRWNVWIDYKGENA